MSPQTAQETRIKDHLKCLVICILMALANCQYGYDAGVIASFQAMKGFLQVFGYPDPKLPGGYGIDTTNQQLITSFLNVGTMFGVIFTSPFAHFLGRRPGIWVGSFIAYVGVGIQIGTTSIAGICAGRALVGASNAFYFTFVNAYVTECSPAHLRSVTAGIISMMLGVGNILGTVTVYCTNGILSKLSYQIPLACLCFFPTVLAVIALCIPESPRWLLVKGRKAEAEKALYALRGSAIDRDLVQEEFIEMAQGIEEENALVQSKASFTEIFKGTNLRRTILCVGAVTSRAAAGLWVFLSYGTYFLQQAGIQDPFAMHLYTSGAGIVSTGIAISLSYLVFGRRAMVLIGTAGAAVCMTGAALGGTIAPGTQEAAKNYVAWSVIYSVVYASFAGMVTWPISAEVVSSRLRVHSLALATGVDYFFAWLTAFCSPYFINPSALNWGVKYCWVWAGSNILTFLFFYFLLPEMKGRSLEEIDELFENKVPTRDFPKYECHCSRQAHELVTEKRTSKTTTHVERIEGTEKDKAFISSNTERSGSSD